MREYKGILICGETAGNDLSDTTKELMRTGLELADTLKESLVLLIIGEDLEACADEGIFLGAETVYLAKDAPFSNSTPEIYTRIIAETCRRTAASVILLGHTDMGRDVAPRLAAQLEAAVCLDCTKISIEAESKKLLQTKPVYGGNALAVWASEDGFPRVVTMRPRSSEPAERDASRTGEIVELEASFDDAGNNPRLIESVEEKVRGIKLEDAKVIAVGGGGIGGADGFRMLEDLAQTLGGTVGISRVPKDEGWMDGHLEIGQTGRVVRPDLYIAVGISGAPQHMAGCSGAKTIVAVNKDPEAHIFEEADFGIVGDYKDVLPFLTKKLKEMKKK